MEVSGQLHAPTALDLGTHDSPSKGQVITRGYKYIYMDFIICALLQILLG